jgi:hypothetical protein
MRSKADKSSINQAGKCIPVLCVKNHKGRKLEQLMANNCPEQYLVLAIPNEFAYVFAGETHEPVAESAES